MVDTGRKAKFTVGPGRKSPELTVAKQTGLQTRDMLNTMVKSEMLSLSVSLAKKEASAFPCGLLKMTLR